MVRPKVKAKRKDIKTASIWPADSVERRAVASLTVYADNPRIHSASQVGEIARSMQEWGWTVPVLIDETGEIIAGHGRVMAAKQLGLVDIPVMVAKGWTDAQKRAYVIADNQIPQNATWDQELLQLNLSSLKKLDYPLHLTGFSQTALVNDLPIASDSDAKPTKTKTTIFLTVANRHAKKARIAVIKALDAAGIEHNL